MSTISLRLPNSLHDFLRKLSEKEGISINQFISTAVAEKVSALATEEHLEKRAARGSRSKFLKVMKKVSDVAPDPEDSIL